MTTAAEKHTEPTPVSTHETDGSSTPNSARISTCVALFAVVGVLGVAMASAGARQGAQLPVEGAAHGRRLADHAPSTTTRVMTWWRVRKSGNQKHSHYPIHHISHEELLKETQSTWKAVPILNRLAESAEDAAPGEPRPKPHPKHHAPRVNEWKVAKQNDKRPFPSERVSEWTVATQDEAQQFASAADAVSLDEAQPAEVEVKEWGALDKELADLDALVKENADVPELAMQLGELYQYANEAVERVRKSGGTALQASLEAIEAGKANGFSDDVAGFIHIPPSVSQAKESYFP